MQYACGAELAGKSSSNIENITCENCKRTNLYKRLKSQATQKLKDETMKIGKDIVAEVKQSESATIDKACNNCGWCKDLSCTNKFNQSKEFKFIDNRCAQWTPIKKGCSNCSYMCNDICYHIQPDTVIEMSDGKRCCEYKDKTYTASSTTFDYERLNLDNKAISKEDEAINLLNEVAEMFKLAELDTDAKLKVIDFIESRVRQGRL
jgi:protein gp37